MIRPEYVASVFSEAFMKHERTDVEFCFAEQCIKANKFYLVVWYPKLKTSKTPPKTPLVLPKRLSGPRRVQDFYSITHSLFSSPLREKLKMRYIHEVLPTLINCCPLSAVVLGADRQIIRPSHLVSTPSNKRPHRTINPNHLIVNLKRLHFLLQINRCSPYIRTIFKIRRNNTKSLNIHARPGKQR